MARTVKLTDYQYELVVCILETRALLLEDASLKCKPVDEMIKEIDDLLKTFDGAKQC